MLTKLLSLFLTFTLLSGANKLFAAEYYWVGGGADANWTTQTNWSDTPGGAGNFGVPGTTDNVFFTPESSNPCNINVIVDVADFIIETGYLGKINITSTNANTKGHSLSVDNFEMNGGIVDGGTSLFSILVRKNFTQTDGSFNQKDKDLIVNNNFNISEGSFIGCSSINNTCNITIGGNFTQTDGSFTASNGSFILTTNGTIHTFRGNFSHNNGSTEFRGNTTINGSPVFSKLQITANGNRTFNITNTIKVTNDLILAGTGNISINGAGIISLTGTTDQKILSNATAGIPNLTIDKTSGLVSVNSDINIRGTLAMIKGNINMGGKTLTLGTTNVNLGTLKFVSGLIYNGTFARWYDANATVTAGTDAALFPLGSSQNDNRQIYISTTAGPDRGGIISVQHDENVAASNTDFMDNVIAIRSYLPFSWNITTTGLSGGTYDMQIRAAGLQINDLNNIRITKSGSVTGAHGTATGTLADATLTRTGIPFNDLNGAFRIGSTESITPLPVELISFNAAKANQTVKLSWETASEKNNDYFIIERSANGRNFEAIGKVKGAGSSNALNAYAFADKNPLNGVSYYRLKQTDFDGKFEYSKIVSVIFEGKLASVAITAFPNPTINVLNVSVNGLQGKATLEITDVTGRSLKQVLVNGSETATLNVETLPKGMYQIRVISENGSSVSKFLKQ